MGGGAGRNALDFSEGHGHEGELDGGLSASDLEQGSAIHKGLSTHINKKEELKISVTVMWTSRRRKEPT